MLERTVTPRSRHGSSSQWELAAIAALMVATFLLSRRLDLFENFDAWTRRYEHLGVDEIVLPALTGMASLAFYALRRYRETLAQTRRLEATEQVLEAKSEHFRSLFEYNPTGVFSVDRDGRFSATNAAAQTICGYGEAELVGRGFQDLISPVDHDRAAESFLSVISGCPQQLETRIVHKRGHLVELSLTGVPIVIEGEVVGMFAMAQDIGERVRILEELERARVDAVQTTELKSLFVANVSHEIRTPLTSVLAALEMIQDTELDPEQLGLADTADRAGRRLLRLVEDLLDFSELESDRILLQTVGFLPEELATAVSDRLGPAARAKGLDFSCHVDPELGEQVSGDLDRISQVLSGLADNAVKFTETGWVRLSLELAELRPTAMDVRFVVQDSGIGLAPEQHHGLFESFSQVDPSISRPYEGAGLGLAICRRLVTLMGGSISVEGTPGAGSTFSFQLPLSRMPSAAHEPAVTGRLVHSSLLGLRTGLTFLGRPAPGNAESCPARMSIQTTTGRSGGPTGSTRETDRAGNGTTRTPHGDALGVKPPTGGGALPAPTRQLTSQAREGTTVPSLVRTRNLFLFPLLTLAMLAGVTVIGAADASAASRTQGISRAADVALQQVGDPYRYGAAGPRAFDCSGLMQYSFRKAGIRIPRTSSAQAGRAHRIAKDKMRRGDLMFFTNGGGVYHAAMFLRWSRGRAVMVHSPGSGKRVRVDRPWTNRWFAATLRR